MLYSVQNIKNRAAEGQCFIIGVCVSQVLICEKKCKNVHLISTNLSKNVHLKYLFTKKRASQVLIYQKTCKNVQKRAKTCKNVQKGSKTCTLLIIIVGYSDSIVKNFFSRGTY